MDKNRAKAGAAAKPATRLPEETSSLRKLTRPTDWRRLVCAQGEAEPGAYTAAWAQRRDQAAPLNPSACG